jgi:hypothetical protein
VEKHFSTLKASFDNETLDAIKAMVNDLKASYGPDEQTSPASQVPREINVVTKVPKSILNVLHHQFKLMQSWMEPVYKETKKQGKDFEKIKTLLTENLAKYEILIDELQTAISKNPT